MSIIVAKKLIVWVGRCGSGDMLGPFYDRNINWQSYLNLLNDEPIPWWQCNFKISSMKIDFIFCGGPRIGPLAIFFFFFFVVGLEWDPLPVHTRLKQLSGETVLNLHNNTEWPPRSPDLTPCDFKEWHVILALRKFECPTAKK